MIGIDILEYKFEQDISKMIRFVNKYGILHIINYVKIKW